MTWKRYQNITIDGHYLDSESILLRKSVLTVRSDFEKDVFDFLIEWFDDSPYLTFQTSGSTGKPKEITFHKDQCVASAWQTIQTFCLQKGDRVGLALPVRYVASKMMIIRAIVGGLNLVMIEPSSLPQIEGVKLDFGAFTPLQMSNLLNNKPELTYQVKITILGGSPVNDSLVQTLVDRQIVAYETYGMTETLTHIAIKNIYPKRENFFLPLENIRLRKSANECLVIEADYLGQDSIETNDVVRFEKQNAFTILGRKDNIINSGGVKLNPEILEKRISVLFEQYCYLLVPIPDEQLGQKMVLVVESKNITQVEIQRIKKNVSSLLKGFEKPKEILFLAKFSRTETGKLDRKRTLRQILEKRT